MFRTPLFFSFVFSLALLFSTTIKGEEVNKEAPPKPEAAEKKTVITTISENDYKSIISKGKKIADGKNEGEKASYIKNISDKTYWAVFKSFPAVETTPIYFRYTLENRSGNKFSLRLYFVAKMKGDNPSGRPADIKDVNLELDDNAVKAIQSNPKGVTVKALFKFKKEGSIDSFVEEKIYIKEKVAVFKDSDKNKKGKTEIAPQTRTKEKSYNAGGLKTVIGISLMIAEKEIHSQTLIKPID